MNLLAGVKTEWTKYGEVLDTVQKKLNQASETIEKAKARSRAIGRKLKDVQERLRPKGDYSIIRAARLDHFSRDYAKDRHANPPRCIDCLASC